MDKNESKKKTERQIEVMKAYLEGKDLQCRYKGIEGGEEDEDWKDVLCPSWNWYGCDYRIKPDESEGSKNLMSNRQVSELLAKRYGECTFLYDDETISRIGTSLSYAKGNEDLPVHTNLRIRPWGSDEWLEPTVDIYEEYVAQWNRTFGQDGDAYGYSDYEDFKPRIGEIFQYNGKMYKCIEGDDCDKCAFYGADCCSFNCSNKRQNGKGVVFVDVTKKENTTSEYSSSTVSKEEKVGIHKRTPQETADFFNCFVAMDGNCSWYMYEYAPTLMPNDLKWSCEQGECHLLHVPYPYTLKFLEIPENHNWRTLYRPHQKPFVMEEEE